MLLSDVWAGLCDHIGATPANAPELSRHEALGELTGYLAAHSGRVNSASATDWPVDRQWDGRRIDEEPDLQEDEADGGAVNGRQR